MSMRRVVSWLKKYTADPRRALTFFTQGGFVFAGGMMGLLLVNQFTEPSLKQEVAALICLLITIAGGALALWGYLSISLFKILIYLLEREPNNDDS